jgi:hypothetical protein
MFALSEGGGLRRRLERLHILCSALLCISDLELGSPHIVLELSLRRGSLGDVPHGLAAWIPARYLDGSIALAWIFERPDHVSLMSLVLLNFHIIN